MKKNKGSWIAALMFLLIGGVAGIFMGQAVRRMGLNDAGWLNGMTTLAVMIWSLIFAMVLQIAVHEAGHGVFGALTGYRLVSYRIFSLMWIRDGERLRFCCFSLAGTGGQCLMEPPGDDPNADFPVTLYNLGGSLMNLICAAACFALAFAFERSPVAWMLLGASGVVGVGFALVNGIPLSLNTMNNDGRNALELRRNAPARRAFWLQMKMNALTARGVRQKDMPEEWFALPDAAGMKDSLTASLAVFAANRLMDERRFDEADALMARLLARPGAIPGIYRAMLVNDRAYCELIGQNRPQVIDRMLDKAQLKAMKALARQPSVMRTQFALALLHENDAAKAAQIERRFDAMLASYPYPTEAECERELMERARNKNEQQEVIP